jgi:hypothetical protein
MPKGRALDLLNAIHDQLALQEIRVEVIVEDRSGSCGEVRLPLIWFDHGLHGFLGWGELLAARLDAGSPFPPIRVIRAIRG